MKEQETNVPIELLYQRFDHVRDDAHAAAQKPEVLVKCGQLAKVVVKNYGKSPIMAFWTDHPKVHECIREFNAVSLVMMAECDGAETIPERMINRLHELALISRSIIELEKPEGLQLRCFKCSRCGDEIQLYAFADTEDTRLRDSDNINTKAVNEFMYKSHICDVCWQKFVYTGK